MSPRAVNHANDDPSYMLRGVNDYTYDAWHQHLNHVALDITPIRKAA